MGPGQGHTGGRAVWQKEERAGGCGEPGGAQGRRWLQPSHLRRLHSVFAFRFIQVPQKNRAEESLVLGPL